MMASTSRIMLLAILVAGASGCYDYVQVETAPPVGRRVALDISDRGRVALGSRFGPGLAQIEGTLVDGEGPEYVIDVLRVSQVSGTSSQWSGEETRLSRDFVGSVRTRRLSKWRTGLLVVGVASGLAALAARGIGGTLSEAEQQNNHPPPVSIRIPIHR